MPELTTIGRWRLDRLGRKSSATRTSDDANRQRRPMTRAQPEDCTFPGGVSLQGVFLRCQVVEGRGPLRLEQGKDRNVTQFS